jgi:hypothetical protein
MFTAGLLTVWITLRPELASAVSRYKPLSSGDLPAQALRSVLETNIRALYSTRARIQRILNRDDPLAEMRVKILRESEQSMLQLIGFDPDDVIMERPDRP